MKLFITDYDETLFTSKEIIKKNVLYLKKLQAKNYLIIISTGRSYPSIKEQVNLYQIPYDYLSCADGSIIYDKAGKEIYKSILDPKIIPYFTSFYQKLNYEEIQFSYKEGYSNILKDKNNLLGINICLSSQHVTKEILKDFYQIKEKYPNYNYLYYAHPNYTYLCIKPLNISKSYAVKVLKDYYSLTMDDIYVIGDSLNDLEMIRDYHGVGMKNSCQEILNIVSKTYNEVYEYINDIIK